MAIRGSLQKFGDYMRTPWDDLIFKLHIGWEETGKRFLNKDGKPATMKLVRDDDADGTMHLVVDPDASDVDPIWYKTTFDFVDGNVLTLGKKFPQVSELVDVKPEWVALGDKLSKLTQQPGLELAIIKGFYDGNPVFGIFLPDSVRISGGRLAGNFLFVINFPGAPDGGATGPPPNP